MANENGRTLDNPVQAAYSNVFLSALPGNEVEYLAPKLEHVFMIPAAACECYAVLRDEYRDMVNGNSSSF